MDNMFETGLAQRKATLGDAYVDGVFETADAVSYTHLTLPTICSV